MSRNGDTLHYSIAPNGGIKMFEYVNFDILEATNNVGVVAAQSAPPRKDIPAIAKAANGAIVSIVMSDKDGSPIAQGSGFLVSKDGIIVTNYHVISEGSSAIVKFPDGAFYVVDGVLASDKARDVAVIKAHGGNFRTLTLGNSDQLQVGEEVVAIGNPLSLESTVSNGIVSGIRTVEEEGGKFLQVTTPISPGSSGGPLFNMAGEVVGITTLYLKGGENLNFAIPINDAKSLLLAKFSKIQALPNEPEPVHAETHEGNTPSSVPAPTAKTNPSAHDYYQQLYDAGGLSGSYVCFSDNSPRGTLTTTPDQFFTFEAWAYDQNYYDAFDKLFALRTSSMPGATNKEKMAAVLVRGQTPLTPEEQTQVDIMERVERSALPYVHFFFREWLDVFSPEDQQFYRNGGRSLFEYFYDKGVKISTNVFHWDGNTWFQSIPPTDPKAYVRESYIERLTIEPTTMRYANSATLTKTAGSGETAATVTRDYDASGGVCEKIQPKRPN
jgi:hypothetical protein